MKAEAEWRAEFCPPHLPPCEPDVSQSTAVTPDLESLREHHSVRLIWEYLAERGHWRRLELRKGPDVGYKRRAQYGRFAAFHAPGSDEFHKAR